MAKIFLAYARDDEAFAEKLAQSLSNMEATVWIDKHDIHPGVKWSDAIQEGLEQCELMLVIVTPESMKSKNVEDEWRYFREQNKPIIPISYKPAKVNFQLASLQYIDFNTQNYGKALSQLYSELRRRGLTLTANLPDNVRIPRTQKPLSVKTEQEAKRGINWNRVWWFFIIPLIIAIIGALVQTWPDIVDRLNPPSGTHIPTISPEEPLNRAQIRQTSNTAWTPFTYGFPDDSAGAEMVLVPIGSFLMGSNNGDSDEQPMLTQTIDSPYWIDKTEVTRGQYMLCVAARACSETPESDSSTRDTQPINRVTWFQARDFCKWRNARLPTETEWEYAARGPNGWIYPWGNEFVAGNVIYSGNSTYQTANVGSLPGGVSWVGAYEMSGNVMEWVSSLYQPYSRSPNDGRENLNDTTSLRILRGGAFNYGENILRNANRIKSSSDGAVDTNGLRCARDS
ncbi:MAG: SUMF1/EgtB/PvdO family nonheme iron enzyme [Anaerolineae bacterium]|nr:SUMF1/EgtB/PvdO family nonheme iron enzyme [Anaerolineae bacterium]